MNVDAYLQGYSAAALKVLASRRGAPSRFTRRAELEPWVKERLFDREWIATHLQALSLPEGMALVEARRQGGKVSALALEVHLRSERVQEPRDVLRALMSRGLLLYSPAALAGRGPQDIWGVGWGWGRSEDRELWLPPEVLAAMSTLEPPQPEPEPPMELEAYAGEVTPAPGSLAETVRDAYTIVQSIARKPLSLTRDGEIRRPDINRLNKELGASGSFVERGWNWKPGRIELLFDILFRVGLLVNDEAVIEAGSAVQSFFALPPAEQARRFLDAYLGWHGWDEMRRLPGVDVTVSGYYGYVGYEDRDYPDQRRREAARRLIVKALAMPLAVGRWISLRSLLGAIRQRDVAFLYSRASTHGSYRYYARQDEGFPYGGIRPSGRGRGSEARFDKRTDWDKVEGAFITNLLQEPLTWFGIAQVGLDPEGRPVAFRLTAAGAEALGLEVRPEAREETPRGLTIQPNFEMVLLTDVVGFGPVAELDRFAERLSMDRAVLFRLTRDSIYRGLRGGLTIEMILARLEALNQGPLPQNVLHSLREWGARYGALRLQRAAMVVTADSPEELDGALRALGPSTRLGPMAALLPPGSATVVPARKRPDVRWCDYAAEPEGVLQVSAEGRIAVPPKHLTPYLRYRLAGVALPAGEEGAFALDADRVRASLRGGVAIAEIERFLETAAAGSIPADVRLMLRAWSGAFSFVGMTPVTAIHSSPALLDQLAASETYRGAIAARPAPGVALLSSEQAPAVQAGLERLGLTVGSRAELLDIAASAVPTPNAEPLYIMPPREVRSFLERAAAEKRDVVIAYLPWGAKRVAVQRVTAQEVAKGSSNRFVFRGLADGREVAYEMSTIQGVRMADT